MLSCIIFIDVETCKLWSICYKGNLILCSEEIKICIFKDFDGESDDIHCDDSC